jgi:hypothetical protein
MSASLNQAQAAKPRAAKVFGDLVGNVAVGIMKLGKGFGLKVNLTEKPATGVSLPKDIEGVPVKVEVVGRIRKRAP